MRNWVWVTGFACIVLAAVQADCFNLSVVVLPQPSSILSNDKLHMPSFFIRLMDSFTEALLVNTSCMPHILSFCIYRYALPPEMPIVLFGHGEARKQEHNVEVSSLSLSADYSGCLTEAVTQLLLNS